MNNPYFDRQLMNIINILEHDYAGLARSDEPADFRYYIQAAGMAWKQKKLDQMLFMRYVSQMLATTMDRSLRLAIESSEYQPWHAGFDVRRFGDALYVTNTMEDTRLHPGDRIIEINGRSPGEHRARFQKNFLYGNQPEREMWGNVLKMAEAIAVEHQDGEIERLQLLRFEGHRPCKKTYLEQIRPCAVRLAMGNLDDNELSSVINDNQDILDRAELLILDLRNATGNDPTAILPLMPYILRAKKTMNEADGQQTIRTLYTRENCMRRIEQLRPYSDDPDVAGMIAELERRSGEGWVTETFALWDDMPEPLTPRGNSCVLLTDTWTEGAPEFFVLLAKREGRARIVGRPTMGNLDYSSMIHVRISDTAILTYPISISDEAAAGGGYLGKGVMPDSTIPFTPQECCEDVILNAATASF